MRSRVGHGRRAESYEREPLRLVHAQPRGDAAEPIVGPQRGDLVVEALALFLERGALGLSAGHGVGKAGEVRRQHDVDHQQREQRPEADRNANDPRVPFALRSFYARTGRGSRRTRILDTRLRLLKFMGDHELAGLPLRGAQFRTARA